MRMKRYPIKQRYTTVRDISATAGTQEDGDDLKDAECIAARVMN